MKTNVWLDDEVMAVLQESRDKLEKLGAVIQISPASVHGEGVVASLLVSSTERSIQASHVAFEIGAEVLASRGRDKLDEDAEAVAYLHELSTNWQPISTAPNSGTIRLWWRTAGETTGGFAIDENWKVGSPTPREGWKGDTDECIPANQEDCTHWMLQSLPPPGQVFPHFAGQSSEQDILRGSLSFMYRAGLARKAAA